MTSGDWLPAQAPFDVVRRGFSPEQVTAHLERLEYDLRITTADRDGTNQRLRELAGQLAAAQGESDMLRAQLDRTALEPVSMSNLSDRMQRMIRLAEEEAGEIRARSEADADRLRGQLEQSLAETAAARAAFDAERERTRKQLAEQVHGLIAEASAEADQTRAAAEQESARLLQEAGGEAERTVLQARQHAQQLVDEAQHTTQQQLADAAAEADRTVSEANAAAAALTAQTAAERERLDAESLAHRTQVEEDFQIAITARRADAARVIAEREAESDATARTLVADATARAHQLVATATEESERLVTQATTYANALVNRAAAESHRRVADADEAIRTLTGLREQLVDQLQSLTGHLDHIRQLAGSAPALLTPPDQESGRPVAEDFPADPTLRPTEVDLPVPQLAEQSNGGAPVSADSAPPEDSSNGVPAADENGQPADGAEADEADVEPVAAAEPAAPREPELASGNRFRNRGGRLR